MASASGDLPFMSNRFLRKALSMIPRHWPLAGTCCAGFVVGVIAFLLIAAATPNPQNLAPAIALILATTGTAAGLLAGVLHNARVDRVLELQKAYRRGLSQRSW